jgi:hypothetical protein
MNRVPAIAFAVAASAAFATAQAQYGTARPTTKVPGVTTATPGGGFQQGADDCNAAHTNIGSGDQFGVPFTTGTTGTTGQNEANCYAFASTVVDNDVWFDWTSTASGNGRVNTCGLTGIDTKIAVYPLSTCPADGTSLACNDDACPGFQTTVVWTATAGTTYTIQLGTFPGASGGSGVFDVSVSAPPACGQYDTGVATNALGLVAGGETGWIHYFDCLNTVDQVSTAYGAAAFPGGITNGNTSQIAVYDDPDTTPGNGNEILLNSVSTVVVNASTDILNANAVPASNAAGNIVVLASANQIAGEFPAPMDEPNPTPNAWIVGSTLGPDTLDIANLANNNVAPLQIQAIGFPASWLLRTENTGGSGGPGTAICFGDGTGAPCGCGNESAPGSGGCNTTLGIGGTLSATGNASVSNDTMALTADNVVNQPGLFFQGNNAIGGGSGATFGDGIRCCGQAVVRIQVVNPPGTANPATAQMTETATTNGPAGTVQAGNTKCYQFWFRDPSGGGVCGSSFNFTNAVSITWGA